ncbi:F-box only protein 9-like [Ptychodera flava]|uniref:F-box only protein 9-like n=1 Tax=Ptychodera flava TaxID=63121 RepID=UPI00396A12F4
MASNECIIPLCDDVSDEEEEEENANNPSIEVELANFRQKWQDELSGGPNKSFRNVQTVKKNKKNEEQATVEERAKHLFLQGVNAEKNGDLYEAIRYYRQAVQLVPDIEFKITDYVGGGSAVTVDEDESDENESTDSYREDDKLPDVTQHLQSLTIDTKSHCEPRFPQTATHISALPVEVLMYILRWVVSTELDMRSLEQVSLVCRGFFACARDPEIWKIACTRVWGINCHLTKEYKTWRSMFIDRPHLKCNGVYISKASYIRHGEQSLDSFYRPWHTVEYYRYIRVFPDGEIQMLTSPETPYTIIPKLRTKYSKLSGVLSGHYRIVKDKIFAVLNKTDIKIYDRSVRRYRRQKSNVPLETEQTFHVEMIVHNVRGIPQAKLSWDHYSCHTLYRSTNQTSTAEFELDINKYPPFYFSRVKSYTATATSPLM